MTDDLKIDEEFKTIIPPLTEEEYANLEKSLRSEGCRDAIMVWDGVIVDGHNRYELCRKWGIPFRTIRTSFSSREAAISWICLNQLSRRNLTREAYKYLIGKRYDAEKAACSKRNQEGKNQYSLSDKWEKERFGKTVAQWTSRRLAGEYNLTHATVERYGEYSRSLDRIEEERPGMLPSLLSGRCRISQHNLAALAKLPGEQMGQILDKIMGKGEKDRPASLKETRSAIAPLRKSQEQIKKKSRLDMKVKEMPEYNPDAELNGLAFTIPTWIDMITRLSGVPVRYASQEAKRKMRIALGSLQQAIADMQKEMEDRI